ncbi:MAG: peptidyl-prolyl cis-trans isomerase, partial [Candidatus Omnitrophica bacterium]|nr:peptidyl-prolyl cis-trans isomerase [Candidatus Omnitrophota bacterium]
PFETPNGMVLVNVTERRDAYIPDYEEVKNKVKDSYLLEKAREVAKEKTREAREKISAAFAESPAADFAQLAKDLGLNLYQSPDFSRGQYLPIIGISKEFENAAFDLTKEAPVSEVIDQTKGFAILHLDNKTPADPDKLPEQRVGIEEALLQERKNQTFTEFMTTLRVESNLDNNLARRQAEQQALQSTSQ